MKKFLWNNFLILFLIVSFFLAKENAYALACPAAPVGSCQAASGGACPAGTGTHQASGDASCPVGGGTTWICCVAGASANTTNAGACTLPNGTDGVVTEFGCIPSDPVAFAGQFYGIGLGFIGALSVAFIIYGGYTVLTSQGDPLKLQTGKSYLYYAIAGLLLAIFGYVFIQLVLVDILKIPGFSA